DAGLQRRPEDVPVWRARLSLAMATGRVEAAREALVHLPAQESSPAQVQTLAAWFAARRGDLVSEKRALEQLIAAAPGRISALVRLAEIAIRAGQKDRANELQREKIEVERLEARYQKLHQRNQPLRDAAEMARLAERLGHWFEAKVSLHVAATVDPDRVDLP